MYATRYAALWSDGNGPPLTGAIELDGRALLLEGARPGREARRRVTHDKIGSFRLARGDGERIRGRTALVLELLTGETIRVATPEPGALHELVEALTLTQRS